MVTAFTNVFGLKLDCSDRLQFKTELCCKLQL